MCVQCARPLNKRTKYVFTGIIASNKLLTDHIYVEFVFVDIADKDMVWPILDHCSPKQQNPCISTSISLRTSIATSLLLQ